MKKIRLAFIIEDDPIQVYIINRLMEQTQRIEEIKVFSNGKDAFDALGELVNQGLHTPELILLDLNMPVWDGWMFLEALAENSLKSRAFILSSSTSSDDKLKASRLGLHERYFTKPINKSTLDKVIDRVCDVSNPL
jgi:CheY-like chemotaxis protein